MVSVYASSNALALSEVTDIIILVNKARQDIPSEKVGKIPF